ncbi:MAG: PilT/PilU family type 4a pilus ATPase [bacterium]
METQQLAILNRILITAVKKQASDLHLVMGKQPVMRVDDKLVALETEEVLTADWLKQLAAELLNDEQKAVLSQNKEVTFIYGLENQFRFKVNVFFQRGYLSISWRLIPAKVKTLAELGLPTAVSQFVQLKRGLVIVAGPFGSGRTSTIAALLEEINKTRAEHIITIERPIEFLFANKKSIIEQREVGQDTNSFLAALDDSHEEDVDVLMVEEMDEPAVMASVLDLANAGSLIFGAMNTDSVSQTLEKIIFSFQSFERERIKNLLANALEGIIAQRLLPKVGGGMVLAAEVLVSTLAVKSLIREDKVQQLKSVLQTSGEEGMITLDRSLAGLVKQGLIARETALAYSASKEDFNSFFRT